MELKDFLYNSASGLAFFDLQVLKALKIAETNLKSTIVPDTSPKGGFGPLFPHVSLFNWEPVNNNICYGQFLKYKKLQEPVKFWAGLNIQKQPQPQKQDEVSFILWFFDKDLPSNCSLRTQGVTFSGNKLIVKNENNSWWVILDNTNFDSFCNSPHNSKIISGFIEAVLQAT